MRMTIILALTLLLAAFPLLIAVFFLVYSLPRKLSAVKKEIKYLTGPGAGKTNRSKEIQGLADTYFTWPALIIPSFLLTVFYLAGFLLCDSYLGFRFPNSGPADASATWLFPKEFLNVTIPLLYAFVGVFLFNLGTMIRRLYLADINKQVFWGAINRMLLSMGLALVIMNSGAKRDQPWLYFSIGFLANIVLDWVLKNALKLLDIRQPKQPDLPLQMVRGIDIWKEYRLEEEAIESVQNLATADVVDLAVRTHYNMQTLIDWIDQSIVLARFNNDQVKTLTKQAMAISAIELATAAPRGNPDDRKFSDALAAKLHVDRELMAATLDRLYEDNYVRNLWNLWQRGTDPLATEAPQSETKGAQGTFSFDTRSSKPGVPDQQSSLVNQSVNGNKQPVSVAS